MGNQLSDVAITHPMTRMSSLVKYAPRKYEKNETEIYQVEIETSNRNKASLKDADVFFRIVGTKTATYRIEFWNVSMEPKQKFTFEVRTFDLGELISYEIWKQEHHGPDAWFVDTVTVSYKGKKWVFPFYTWIELQKVSVRAAKAVLPGNEYPEALQERKDQLEERRGIYQWLRFPKFEFPSIAKFSFYEELPVWERWNSEKLQDYMASRDQLLKEFLLDKFLEKFEAKEWVSFDEFKELFRTMKLPECEHWIKDEDFGRRRIQGASVTFLKRLSKRPSNFKVRTKMVKPLLRKGKTLKGEIKEGRVFLIDYALVKDLSTVEGRYIAAPLCLLYLNEKDQLVPIAIQLFQDPTSDWNPIYTPLDPENDWLLAKLFTASADFTAHQIIAHFSFVHVVAEPYVVGLHRCLNIAHPMYKLLYPHFKFQLAIGVLAREKLISENGLLCEILPIDHKGIMECTKKACAEWRFDRQTFPNLLQDRGFSSDPKDLPGYYYREDGLQLWRIIGEYVTDIVNIFYKTDADVVADSEIQNFVIEIAKDGFGPGKNFPEKVATKQHLAEILTTMIFTVSVGHSAVNYPQYEHFAFPPTAPTAMFAPPPGSDKKPVTKGKLTTRDVLNALPPRDVAAKGIAALYLLSSYSSEDYRLGEFPEMLFEQGVVEEPLKKFTTQLKELEKKINDRGVYFSLLPSRIPNSTAI